MKIQKRLKKILLIDLEKTVLMITKRLEERFKPEGMQTVIS